jgi:hypothetical protein
LTSFMKTTTKRNKRPLKNTGRYFTFDGSVYQLTPALLHAGNTKNKSRRRRMIRMRTYGNVYSNSATQAPPMASPSLVMYPA